MLNIVVFASLFFVFGLFVGTWNKGRQLQKEKESLSDTFRALSSEALAQNNQSFLDLAKTSLEKFQEGAKSDLSGRQHEINKLLEPMKKTLDSLERTRAEAQASLKTQVSNLLNMQQQLAKETNRIATALKATSVRGRWGEIQLRRIVELAGMTSHCDFFEQATAHTDDGRRRPDMLVRLPAGKQIIVDAKAPLDAYLEANESNDEHERSRLFKKHASQVRQHIRLLASKAYTDAFSETPEFVVLFLPGETFFSAALSEDPSLIEAGAEEGVILATPTTLIALLRAVFYGWKQESISQNAKVISEMGRDLYKRLSTVAAHWSKVGKNLSSAVTSYNEAVGSLERRVLPKAREFAKLSGSSDTLDILPTVEHTTRTLQSPEMAVPLGETT